MAKKDEAQLEDVQSVETETVTPKKPSVPRTVMDDNRRATELLKQKRKEMNPDTLFWENQRLKAQLKRAQSV